ncbi:uncharacterized protein LOC128501145 isoform X2 [Spea bombifrons]|uniref:uncharacterized protein LOC128501145 isoform X2 n=1 Tax=Spea bombifrons TaxID=233779 RepID=UPI00234965AF|nr:uncharacterized protein LOC128501145 isoform X2 [Spea bombifrons]
MMEPAEPAPLCIVQKKPVCEYRPERMMAVFFCDAVDDIRWLSNQINPPGSSIQTSRADLVSLPDSTQQEWKDTLMASSINILCYSKPQDNQRQGGQSEPKSLQGITYTRAEVVESFLQLCIDTEVLLCGHIYGTPQDPVCDWSGIMGSQALRGAIDLKESKKPIGIISMSADGGKWLETMQLKDGDGQTMRFRHIDISRLDNKRIKEEISECSYWILHVTRETIEDEGVLSLFINRALVVFDDPEYTRSPELFRTLKNAWISNVSLMADEEKTDHWFQVNEEESQRAEHQLFMTETFLPNKEKIVEEEEALTSAKKYQKMRPPYTVGIFSRSIRGDYEWIQALFRSECFRDHITAINSCEISNNGFQRFLEEVSKCTVGILYHTKQRGRINITDVTDSLYDRELQILSDFLGKENVFVLVDDMDESGPEEKIKILESQPSIGRYAGELLLIAQREKQNEKRLQEKLYRLNALE